MTSRFRIVALLFAASTASAMAACPSVVTSTTAEAIAANSERLLCLQQEIASETAARNDQLNFKILQQTLQADQLQQRFDSLPKITIPTFEPKTN